MNYLEEGKSFHNQKNYKKALLNFEKALSLNPCEKGVHFEIGKTYYVQGKYAAAIAEFKKEISINPKFPYTYLLLAKVYKKQGKFDEAIKAFDKAVELGGADKEIARANSEKAGIYLEQKKYGLAIEQIDKVIKLGFDKVQAYVMLGNIYRQKKEYEKAVKGYKKALESANGNKEDESKILDKIGQVYLEKGELKIAIRNINKALKYDKFNDFAHTILGNIHKQNKEYKKALKEYKKSIELVKGNKKLESEVYSEIAQVYLQKGNCVLAVKGIKKALKYDGDNEQAYRISGSIFMKKKEYKKALAEYLKALELAKGNKELESAVYNEIAHIYLEEGNYALAMENAKEAIKYDKYNRFAYRTLGSIHRYRKEYEEALNGLDKALGFCKGDKEKSSDIYSEKAQVYIDRKEYEAALSPLKKAIELNPSNLKARLLLAKVYMIQAKYKEALKEYGMAIRLNTGDKSVEKEVYEYRAQIYSYIEKYGSMAEEINRLIKMGFSNILNYTTLSVAYKMQGLNEEAEKAFNKASAMIKKEKRIEIEATGVSFRASKKEENRVANEKEIARGETRLKSKVRSLNITLTNRCNLNCKMCFVEKVINSEMTRKVKEEIISTFPYLEEITWLGGEVFLDPDFSIMLDESIKYGGIRQNITTNGLLLTEELVKKFIKNGILLGVSIDGTTKEVYESIRKGAIYEQMIEKLNMVNRTKKQLNPGYCMNLNVVVMKSNYRQIESFPEFARKHNFKSLNYMMIAENRNNENIFNFNRDENILSYIDRALDKAREKCREYGINFSNNITKNILQSNNALKNKIVKPGDEKPSKAGAIEEEGNMENKKVMCTAPWRALNIGISGNVSPYMICSCRYVVGNLNEASMEEIWNGERMVKYRERIVAGDIDKVCDLKKVYNTVPVELLK